MRTASIHMVYDEGKVSLVNNEGETVVSGPDTIRFRQYANGELSDIFFRFLHDCELKDLARR